MTGKTKWLLGLATGMIFLAMISGLIGQQKGWLLKVGQKDEKIARAAGIKVSITGRVAEIAESTLILVSEGKAEGANSSAKGKQVKIAINQKTRFEKTDFDDSGMPTRQIVGRQYVKKNDVVSIDALLQKGDSLFASVVMISPRPDEKVNTPVNGYTGGSVINGTVDSLKDNGFSVKTENGETLNVALDKGVSILVASQGQKPEQGTAKDIAAGVKISVMGVRQTSGELLARQIMCVK